MTQNTTRPPSASQPRDPGGGGALVDSPAASASRTTGSDFAELSGRVARAGLLQRRPGYYTLRIGDMTVLFAAAWTGFVLLGDFFWWQLATAAALGGIRALFRPVCRKRRLEAALLGIHIVGYRARPIVRAYCAQPGLRYTETGLVASPTARPCGTCTASSPAAEPDGGGRTEPARRPRSNTRPRTRAHRPWRTPGTEAFMPAPKTLTLYRHDTENQALITLSGEMDLDSAPVVRESLARCLCDGVRAIHIDLTNVTFCDCHSLGVLLEARLHAVANGGSLRVHHPRPVLSRLFDLTGAGPFLLDPQFRHMPLAA